MTCLSRAWAASLIVAAASVVSYTSWAAVEDSATGSAVRPVPPAQAQGPASPADIPVLAAPQASGKGAPPLGVDANDNRISDALEARIEAAAPGEMFDVIVVFEGPRRAADRAREVIGPLRIEREFTIINGFQAMMPAAQIRALSAAPGLFRIEENAEVRAFDVPSNRDTGVEAARMEFSRTGSGVTVCVVDTGINAVHEQFDSQGLSATDFADFTANGFTDPYDDNGHGSHVAGIIAGDGTGGSIYAPEALGVAPGVKLKVAKVLASSGGGSQAEVLSGIEWCADTAGADADIISMSLGGNPSDGTDPLSIAVNCATDPSYDIDTCDQDATPRILVIAAGNSGNEPGTVAAPGAARNAITAASFAEWSAQPTDSWQNDGVYLNLFSGRGPVFDGSGTPQPWLKPDIAGPGAGVLSAYINSSDPVKNPVAYAVGSGTSMSTPFISGVIALMLEAHPSLREVDPVDGSLPHEKVRDILALTAVDVGPAGPDYEYGYGLVDALAAVAEAEGLRDASHVTEYPLLPPIPGSVEDFDEWTYPFEVSQAYADARLPIAATLTIEGECVLFLGLYCDAEYSWWAPDLEMAVEQDLGDGNWQLVEADSGEVTLSECPARGECSSSVGRVEVVHFIPKEPGQYRIVVWPFADSPNNGTGGSFEFEFSVVGEVTPSDNTAPVVSITAPEDGAVFTEGTLVSFTGTADDTEDGDLEASLNWTSSLNGPIGTGGSVSTSSLSPGSHTITASATDSGGKSGSDSITLTVSDSTNDPPIASFTVTQNPCPYQQTILGPGWVCEFNNQSTDDDGIVSHLWNYGDGTTEDQVWSPTAVYLDQDTVPGTFLVTLTVTDAQNLSDSMSMNVALPLYAHIGDLDGSVSSEPRNRWRAQVDMLVLAMDGVTPVVNALVEGSWGGGANGGDSCTTGSSGWCSVAKGNLKSNVSSVSFTVGNVSGTDIAYQSSANGDPDGDSDGTSITVSQSGSSEPANEAPAASITSPTGGATFATGTSISFAGSASDPEDGDVTASLVWTSDIDGQIGTGGSFSTVLADGAHMITATATDSNGAKGSDQISVTVGEASDPGGDLSLSATGRKERGVHIVDLDWGGFTTGLVDVYRDGSIVSGGDNLPYNNDGDGTYTDNTGNKGGATYVYQVCRDGSTAPADCTDAVTVIF